MTENFREMKVACNNIVMSIFKATDITVSWGMFLLVWLTKLMVFNLRKDKIKKWERWRPLYYYDLMLNVLSDIAQLFWAELFLDLEFWTRLWFFIYFLFVLHLWSQSPQHLKTIWSISNGNRLIGLCVIWTLWSRSIVLTLYMFYLFYLSISINIFNFIVSCCWFCCCLFVF